MTIDRAWRVVERAQYLGFDAHCRQVEPSNVDKYEVIIEVIDHSLNMKIIHGFLSVREAWFWIHEHKPLEVE